MIFLEVAKFSSRRLRRLAAAAQRGMEGKKKEGEGKDGEGSDECVLPVGATCSLQALRAPRTVFRPCGCSAQSSGLVGAETGILPLRSRKSRATASRQKLHLFSGLWGFCSSLTIRTSISILFFLRTVHSLH